MSIEDRLEIKYKLSNGTIKRSLKVKDQSQKPKKFEVKQFNRF